MAKFEPHGGETLGCPAQIDSQKTPTVSFLGNCATDEARRAEVLCIADSFADNIETGIRENDAKKIADNLIAMMGGIRGHTNIGAAVLLAYRDNTGEATYTYAEHLLHLLAENPALKERVLSEMERQQNNLPIGQGAPAAEIILCGYAIDNPFAGNSTASSEQMAEMRGSITYTMGILRTFGQS